MSHWHTKAQTEIPEQDVNVGDVYQRQVELQQIVPFLDDTMRVLEVGCGNGYSTNVFRKQASWVDAFDVSDAMIDRAVRVYGETNNRFFVDDVVSPNGVVGPYDAVVCVRVLINLPSFWAQMEAVRNIASLVKQQGVVVLVEGFQDGFDELNKLRVRLGVERIKQSSFNRYPYWNDLKDTIGMFDIEHSFHLGMYDYLTRAVYPAVSQEVGYNTAFHQGAAMVAGVFNPDETARFSRVRGLVLRRV